MPAYFQIVPPDWLCNDIVMMGYEGMNVKNYLLLIIGHIQPTKISVQTNNIVTMSR